jgi:outer membrane protein OmpA-like peptidoglycan-associated protein
MKKYLFFFCILSASIRAQEVSDCQGALDINDTLYIQNNVLKGYGKELEIKGNSMDDPYFFEQEHHTAWYRFSPKLNTELSLEILPMDPNDDFDFLLFKAEAGSDFCSQPKSKEAMMPVRSNISRNSPELAGKTGLQKNAAYEFVASGVRDPFSKSISVKKGDIYYLVIDNLKTVNNGYTVVLHYSHYLDWYTVYKRELAYQLRQEVEDAGPSPVIYLLVKDAETGLPVKARLEISGLKPGETVSADTSLFSFETKNMRSYKISCNANGYMFNSLSYTYQTGGKDTIPIKLNKIKVGNKVTLNEIYFEGDETEFLPTSKTSLQNLLVFMQQNPTTKIEIQGHVNGPDEGNKGKFKRLSRRRAKAVEEYLTMGRVEKSRILAKGYGNSQMIYKHPENERQSGANRRVEIKIISQ